MTPALKFVEFSASFETYSTNKEQRELVFVM